MRYVILNADDFGLTPGVTDGILKAHHDGLLTSTTLLVGAPDAVRAARLVRGTPRLGTGIHLALSAVRPILSPRRVRTLVGPDGMFPYSFVPVALRLTLGQIDLIEVYQELEAQILAMQELGLTITHVDGHNHLHVHPRVLPLVLKLMEQHGISAIRLPRPSPGPQRLELRPAAARQRLKGRVLRAATAGAARHIARAGMRTTDHFVGFEHSGHMDGPKLLEALGALPAGTTEIMLHPGRRDAQLERDHGWGYHWEDELEALLDPEVAARVRTEQLQLIHFGELPA